ncbi:MAG TPA: hypothetical protein VF470_00800, partial [Sphingomicrobium sp.]
MRKGARLLAVGFPLVLALIGGPGRPASEAIANNETDVSVERPLYPVGAGPLVAIDAAHNNYHTLKGRYAPFGAVLENDGYRLAS